MDAAIPIHVRSETTETRPISAGATGSVAVLLRAEALIELALAAFVYHHTGGKWLLFAVLFFAPDVSMVGYLINPRAGAHLYNAAHTYLAPALLALAGFLVAAPLLYSLALMWAAHIGFDRVLGYGLKYPVAFGATHLVWKKPRRASIS